MSWKIVYHEERPESPKVGDMWPAPWLVKDVDGSGKLREFFLSDKFILDWNAKLVTRMPLVVRLPGATGVTDFCVDGPCFSNGKRETSGWAVSGTAPRITVMPSINIVGSYHGWIRDGVITDDCEGRKLPQGQ